MSVPSRHQPRPTRFGHEKEILFFKTAEPRVRFDLDTIDGFVPIIATYAGMKTDLLDMLDLSKLDGSLSKPLELETSLKKRHINSKNSWMQAFQSL